MLCYLERNNYDQSDDKLRILRQILMLRVVVEVTSAPPTTPLNNTSYSVHLTVAQLRQFPIHLLSLLDHHLLYKWMETYHDVVWRSKSENDVSSTLMYMYQPGRGRTGQDGAG